MCVFTGSLHTTNLQTLNVAGATNLQTLNVAGDTVVNNLTATGTTNLQTLNVAGTTNLQTLNVAGDTVLNNLSASGVTNLQTLNVAGDSIFNGGATFNQGLTVNNNFTVGGNTTIDMGGNKITNVAAGTDDDDAATVGQINTVVDNLANKPMSFAGNTGSVDRKLGETLNITGGASTAGNYSGSNVKVVADATGIQVQFAENPVFNSVSTVGDASIGGNANIVGNTTIGGSANIAGDTAIGGNTTMAGDLNVAGNTTVNNLSVNANSLVDLGGNKITNVGDGVADSDAVTIKQLNVVSAEANKQASTSAGKNIEVETSLNATGGIDYKVSTADDLVVNSLVTGASSLNRTGLRIANSGPSITTTGINAGNFVITNVADGVNKTDAVNKGQLDEVQTTASKGWELSTNSGATTNVAPGDTVNFVEGQNIKLTNTGRTVTVASASDV